MKKLLSLLLTLLLVVSLAACGADDAPSQANGDSPAQTQWDASQDTVLPEFQKTATIQETVLYDEHEVRITATALTYDSNAVELSLILENNSAENLQFISNSMGYSCNSVNGYMIVDGYLNCDVAAGKKANDTISISYDTLRIYGIFEIADIEIGFDIVDEEYDHIYSGPRQVKTSAADSYNYSTPCYRETIASQAAQRTFGYTVPYFSDEVLHSQDGFAILSSCLMEREDGARVLLLEVQNTSTQPVDISTRDIALNGLGVYSSTWSYDTVASGKTGIITLILSDVLDEGFWSIYGIEDVGSVTLTLCFSDEEGTDLSAPATITVTNQDVESSFSKDGKEIYNERDIRIVQKDVVKEDSDYSGDILALLLVENNTNAAITLREIYDTFSINGYMMDCVFSPVTVQGGACAALEIRLWESDLEENSIANVEDITQIELGVEIEQGRTTIDETQLNIEP